MKSRTVTQRNLAGGFLGGLLGMLAFGYLHSLLLPIGCLLGVTFGWWYEFIFQSVVDGFVLGVENVRSRWNILTGVPTRALRRTMETLSPISRFIGGAVTIFLTILQLPLLIGVPFIRLRHWLQKRRTRQWQMVRGVATFLYYTLNAPLILIFYNIVFGETFGKNEVGLMTFVPMIVFVTLSLMLPLMVFTENEWKYAYRSYSYYCTHSVARSIMRELGRVLSLQVRVVVAIAAMIVWLGSIGVSFMLFFILPITAFVGLVKGLYAAATKAGHWLCFGVTLVVTTVSAWLVSPHFAEPYALWSAALVTGVVSGMATEGVRLCLVALLESSYLNSLVTTPMSARLNPGYAAFDRWTRKALAPVQI